MSSVVRPPQPAQLFGLGFARLPRVLSCQVMMCSTVPAGTSGA